MWAAKILKHFRQSEIVGIPRPAPITAIFKQIFPKSILGNSEHPLRIMWLSMRPDRNSLNCSGMGFVVRRYSEHTVESNLVKFFI